MPAAPPIVSEVLRSPGQPLDSAIRAFMEPRFGHDFTRIRAETSSSGDIQSRMPISQPSSSMEQQAGKLADQVIHIPENRVRHSEQSQNDGFRQVRIHADPQSALSARSVNALAYTVGNDIVFGDGQYAPQTVQGRLLLAHKLAHVWQNQVLSPTTVHRYEGPEHQDLGDKNLEELFIYTPYPTAPLIRLDF